MAIYRRAIEDPTLSGPLKAASPTPCRQADLAAVLARGLHRPNWFRVPAWLLRLVLQGEATLLLGSRRVVPARLLAAGFEFVYSDLAAALADTTARSRSGATRAV